MQKYWKWRLEHEEHGKVLVAAKDKLGAIQEAAKVWKVMWTDIARKVKAERVSEIREAKRK